MTHSTSAPHPAGPHPSIDDLADLAEGLVEGPGAASLHEHLDGCPDCRETLAALAEVSELLGAEPAPPMPEDVAGRIEAALAAEAASRAPVPSAASTTDSRPAPDADTDSRDGAPGDPLPAARPGPTSRPGPAPAPTGPGRPRRRGRRRALLASAFALAAVTLGALLLRTPAPDRAADTAAGAAAASAPSAVAPVRPGTQAPKTQAPKEQPAIGSARGEYREDTLAAQVRELVGAAAAAARPADGEDLTTRTPGPCAPAVTAPLLATDHGTFAGVPVDVLVYSVPGHPDQLDVYLVETDCAAGRGSVLLHRSVPAR